MESLIITIHILACVFLIILVLLQSGQEGMGVIFGGGSNSMFGSSGAGGLLVKVTAFLAATFLITSLVYNVVSGNRMVEDTSIMNEAGQVTAPAQEEKKPAGVGFEDTAKESETETAPATQ